MERPTPFSTPSPRHQGGFALLALIAIVTLGVLYFVLAGLENAASKTSRTTGATQALSQAKEALLGYAVTYADTHANQVFGYLPCPDTDGDGLADDSGMGTCGSNGEIVVGFLPYKTLGLSDLRDETGNCLWYAVSPAFNNIQKYGALNWDTQGQIEVRANDGASVLVKPNDTTHPEGGAAAIIIAPGTLVSGNTNRTPGNQTCGGDTSTQWAAYLESASFGANGRTNASPLVVRLGSDQTGTTNNDRLAWLTPKDLFDRLRKRTDLAAVLDANINSAITNLYNTFNNHLADYPPGAGYTLADTSGIFAAGTTLRNYIDNFGDQFRYRACPTQGSYCFLVDGIYCDGVLLFGGIADAVANGVASPRPIGSRGYGNLFETGASGGYAALSTATPTHGSPVIITGAATGYLSTAPTRDIVQCLTPQMPVKITAAQMFDAGNTQVSGNGLVTTDGSTKLTLGTTSSGSDNTILYGCYWYPVALPFANGLRIYFDYVTNSRSEGFMFALADADPSRNPSTQMCGESSDALGYAGNNGTYAPIQYPKMGLEFDFSRSNPGLIGLIRNDPATSPSMHFAFDFWGVSGGDPDGNDDVTHGAGDGTTDPTNPSGSPGLKRFSSSVPNGNRVYVRLDITRAYTPGAPAGTPGTGAYRLDAFLVRQDPNGSFPSGLYAINCASGGSVKLLQSYMKPDPDNGGTAGDLLTNCPDLATSGSSYFRYLTTTVTINDLSGLGEAMNRIYLGFTTSQRAASNQQIEISNFSAVSR